MDYNIFENSILQQVKSLLNSLNTQFSERGIAYSIQLKKDENDSGNYNSEIEIVFVKNGSFIDIIEFFVYRNGTVYINNETLMNELYLDFEEILLST